MEKPRIIGGKCEFCGTDAKTCPHHKSDTFVDAIKVSEMKVDLYKKLSNKDRVADIIIPHHNRHDHLKDCLERLPNDIFNIIIVSGGSFAANCNKGARLAVTDNIIILNDDTLPDPVLFVDACKSEKDIIGFSQIIPSLGDKPLHGVGFEVIDDKLKIALTDNKDIVKIPAGFAFRIKTEAWKRLGGFDEGFINGGEDSDLFFRAINSDITIGYDDRPIIHKHSQSDGRLTFSAENQMRLDEKWPQEKIKELLGLNVAKVEQKLLNILVTNNHFDNFAGSETWTYTMAKELERIGHTVTIYTKHIGKIAKKIVEAGIPVVSNPEKEYDLIMINHNTCLEDLKEVKGHKIFTSHGIYPQLEQPVEGADDYVAITPEVKNSLLEKGYVSTVIYNGVDLDRFSGTTPTNRNLQNVLCMCKGPDAAALVKEACDQLDVEFKWIKGLWEVEDYINKSDLVVTLGRGALEAMACGREVMVLDSRAYMKKGIVGDGLIGNDVFKRVMDSNYSGRAFNSEFTLEGIVQQLKRYDQFKGQSNRAHVVENHDITSAANKYIDLYGNRNK